MTRFRIPCNWDPGLLDALDEFPRERIADIFGMVPSHVAGGGRPAAAMPKVSMEDARRYIADATSRGYVFNYLFNAPCLDAREFTDAWRTSFLEHLDWAVESGARAVTIAVPYLIEVVKQRYPDIHISVSSYARVAAPHRAAYFKALGADEIIVDPTTGNRDFEALAAMARSVDCTITVIANGICLSQCPFAEYHGVLMGHSSQDGHPSGGKYDEYPYYSCTVRKLTSPAALIGSVFVRPEDIAFYESLGVTSFKLVDRMRPTEWLAASLRAYVDGTYDGDLLQIVNFPHGFLSFLWKSAGMEGTPVFPRVDNRKLDGLIERIRDANCRTASCETCGVCQEFAEKAVENPEGVGRLAGLLAGMKGRLMFGARQAANTD